VLEDNLAEANPCECGNKLAEEKREEKIAAACCVSEPNPVSINRASEKSCC
jgi:hypothetical protein